MASPSRFSKRSIEFIQEAARQKGKGWLEKNRNEYEEVLVSPMRELMGMAEEALSRNAPGYRFPKRNHARILRGAEGAKLHGPFRDWVGVSVSRESKSRYEDQPNLYFHISEGEGIFSAGGLYLPSAAQTKHIRAWIDRDPSLLEELLSDRNFKKRFPELGRERVLKTKPRDYPADHPRIEWLKLSGFYVWREIKKTELFSKDFSDILIEDWRQVLRLNAVLDRYIRSFPRAIATLVETPAKGMQATREFYDDWED
jgi:uncharacterized protein (TIGR02453 family)